jgi:hypothetical protein
MHTGDINKPKSSSLGSKYILFQEEQKITLLESQFSHFDIKPDFNKKTQNKEARYFLHLSL